MRPLQASILLVLAITGRASAQQDVDKLLAESNPAIQKQLEAISRVFRPSDALSDNVEALREIGKLKELTDDKAELVKQVAVFSMAPGEETQPMTAGAILYYLQVPSRVTIRTLAPYLDTKNTQLRSFVRDWFRGHDNAGSEWSPLKPVNYDDYMEYVRRQVRLNEEVPTAFVKYMYERSPGRALHVFQIATVDPSAQLQLLQKSIERAQQGRAPTEQERKEIRQIQEVNEQKGRARRQIVLAEHIVSNAIWLEKHGYIVRLQEALPEAKEALATLAEGEWWARMYVAEIMRRHLKLRQDDVLQ